MPSTMQRLGEVKSRAIIGAIRDVLGPDVSRPGADLIALMETSLNCLWGRSAEPASYAAFVGDARGERAVTALVIAASLRSPGLSEDSFERIIAYADAAKTSCRGFRTPKARAILRSAWHERGVPGILDVLACLPTDAGRHAPRPDTSF